MTYQSEVYKYLFIDGVIFTKLQDELNEQCCWIEHNELVAKELSEKSVFVIDVEYFWKLNGNKLKVKKIEWIWWPHDLCQSTRTMLKIVLCLICISNYIWWVIHMFHVITYGRIRLIWWLLSHTLRILHANIQKITIYLREILLSTLYLFALLYFVFINNTMKCCWFAARLPLVLFYSIKIIYT